MSSFLERLFPEPKLLDVPFGGIDISDHSVRYASLVYKKNHYEIGVRGETRIPDGVVENGSIIKPEELVKVLSRIQTESGLTFIRASLPEEHAYIFELALPRIQENEIRSSIELQLEEHVPLSNEEALFDYEIITQDTEGYLLSVTVFPRALAEMYLTVFSQAGFIPLSFLIESQALSRAILRKEDSAGTHLIVDFGESRTGISIVTNRAVSFTATIDVGGGKLTKTIAEAYNLDRKAADELKRKNGFLQVDEEGKKIFNLIATDVTALAEEIQRHYIYWHTHHDERGRERPAIEKIIFCGGDSNLKGAVEYFGTTLRIPTEQANVWVNIATFDQYVPPIPYNDSLTYATALGLCL